MQAIIRYQGETLNILYICVGGTSKTITNMRNIPLIVLLCVLLSSCGTPNNHLAEYTLQNKTEHLIDVCKSDTTLLAKILLTSEEDIKNLAHGEDIAHSALSERVDLVFGFAVDNGNSLVKLRRKFDPDFSWYEHILFSPIVHPVGFWVITGILLCIFIFGRAIDYGIRHSALYSDALWMIFYFLFRYGILIEIAVFIIAFIIYLI